MTTELVPGSSVGWSEILGRRIRTDGLDTVGISSQTLAVGAIEAGSFQIGRDLGEYFHEEMTRINDILYLWLVDILALAGHKFGNGQEQARRSLPSHEPSAWHLPELPT